MREWSSFVLLHVAVQFSQHHLLTGLYFSHCIFFLFCSLIDRKCMGLYWALQCVLLICVSIFVLILYRFSEKAMAPHSSTLAWKIPWAEEPGRLQSTGSLRVGHDWATSLSLFTFMRWRRKWRPTPVFLPGESQGRGSLVAAVYGVTQSRTLLKWLSIA